MSEADYLVSASVDRHALRPETEAAIWRVCDYSWLTVAETPTVPTPATDASAPRTHTVMCDHDLDFEELLSTMLAPPAYAPSPPQVPAVATGSPRV